MNDQPPLVSTPTPSLAAPERRFRKRAWAIVLGVIALGSFGLWCWFQSNQSTPPQPPSIALDDVEPAVASAIIDARQKVLEDPQSADNWGRLGMVLRVHDFEYEGDDCFKQAEALDPRNPHWPYYRALHAMLREPAKTIEHLRRAAALPQPSNDHQHAVQLLLAEVLLERHLLEEAEAIFQREREAVPDDGRPVMGLALVAIARDDLQMSQARLLEVPLTQFTQKKVAIQKAALFRKMGDKSRAAEFEKVATRLPSDAIWQDAYAGDYMRFDVGLQGKYLRAEQLKAQGRSQEAVQAFIEISELSPSARSFAAAGIILAQLGDLGSAEKYLRECLRLEPDHIQGNYVLAVCLFFQAEHDWADESKREQARAKFLESAEHARGCLARKPDHGVAHQFLGRAQLYLGNTDDAVRQLRLAVSCRSEAMESHLYLAEALLTSGNREEASKSLKVAEQLAKPDDPRVAKLRDRLLEPAKKK